MYQTTPATNRKKNPKLVGAVAIIVALLVGCTGGCLGGVAISGSTPEVVVTPSPYQVTEYLNATPTTAAASTAPAAPAKAAAPTIEDGIWTVGDDFPAGTYRTRDAVTSSCYWGIYKSGTNQGDIVENDIVAGGRPTVTLKRGQDFKTDCGTWVKIK